MTYSLTQYERDQESLPGGPGCDDSPEEIPACHQNAMDAWVNADTGRIISAAEANKLRGAHADKCRCLDCQTDGDDYDWRDDR